MLMASERLTTASTDFDRRQALFEIDGPDADGFVWLHTDTGSHNLGHYDDVSQALCDWLQQTDHGEAVQSRVKVEIPGV
jgi:hypothetical protein